MQRYLAKIEGAPQPDKWKLHKARTVIGYLHTGIEKNCEYRTWQQGVTYVTRADYLSPFFNELGYCLAVERLLGIEAPPRAKVLRVMFCEMNRIASHLVWLGTSGLELGAVSVVLYAFREREMLLDIFEIATGLRMNHAYFRIGGVVMDVPPDGERKAREFLEVMPGRIGEYEDLLADKALSKYTSFVMYEPQADGIWKEEQQDPRTGRWSMLAGCRKRPRQYLPA